MSIGPLLGSIALAGMAGLLIGEALEDLRCPGGERGRAPRRYSRPMLCTYDALIRLVGGLNTVARLMFLGWIILSAFDLGARLLWRLLTRGRR